MVRSKNKVTRATRTQMTMMHKCKVITPNPILLSERLALHAIPKILTRQLLKTLMLHRMPDNWCLRSVSLSRRVSCQGDLNFVKLPLLYLRMNCPFSFMVRIEFRLPRPFCASWTWVGMVYKMASLTSCLPVAPLYEWFYPMTATCPPHLLPHYLRCSRVCSHEPQITWHEYVMRHSWP